MFASNGHLHSVPASIKEARVLAWNLNKLQDSRLRLTVYIMKFLSLPAFVFSLASVSVATSIQQRHSDDFTRVTIPDDSIPKQSLINRSFQVTPLVGGDISANDWAQSVQDQCIRATFDCNGIATYQGEESSIQLLSEDNGLTLSNVRSSPGLDRVFGLWRPCYPRWLPAWPTRNLWCLCWHVSWSYFVVLKWNYWISTF